MSQTDKLPSHRIFRFYKPKYFLNSRYMRDNTADPATRNVLNVAWEALANKLRLVRSMSFISRQIAKQPLELVNYLQNV